MPQKSIAGHPKSKNHFLVFGYLIAIVPLLMFVASLLGRYGLMFELACNFRAYILGALVLTAPCTFALKQRTLIAFWCIAVFWCSLGTVSVYLPAWQSPTPAGQTAMRVMSFNVLGKNHDIDAVTAEIKNHDPDVLVVIEYANHWPRALLKLHAQYPYRIEQPRWHGFGIAVLSKLPFEDAQVILLARQRTDNPLVIVTVNHHGQRIRIAGGHLLSPMDPERLEIRNQQLEEIGDLLSSSPMETVLVGDFNCVPWSAFLSDLLNTTGYRDSRQGFGYHGSWHAQTALISIPIDHAFVSPNVVVHDRFIGGLAGSDHYPLIVDVSIARD